VGKWHCVRFRFFRLVSASQSAGRLKVRKSATNCVSPKWLGSRSSVAHSDLIKIWQCIAGNSPHETDQFLDRLQEQMRLILGNSGMGERVNCAHIERDARH